MESPVSICSRIYVSHSHLKGLALDLCLLVSLWKLHPPGDIKAFPSHTSKVEVFDALLCDVCVRQVSYAVLREFIWGFVHVVEDMRELKPAAALGLLQHIAGTLGPSPSTIDKTTYGYWRARLQGRNRKGTLNDEMKKVALPFLNWSNPSAVPFMG